MERERDLPELGLGKGDEGKGRKRTDGPLDGSTSGTIGGGGPDTGGSGARSDASAVPPAKPDDAASGRMAPDPIGATATADTEGTHRSASSVLPEPADANADRSDADRSDE